MDALYRVCEWQWANPQRFRALLGDDEPTAWVSRVLTMERILVRMRGADSVFVCVGVVIASRTDRMG